MKIAPTIATVLAAMLGTLPAFATPAGDTIFIASDSTAANYRPDRYPQSGWGMMLHCAVTPDIRVANRAKGGRSTRSFLAEGRWDRLVAELTPGDTVLIQFGHNDRSKDRPDRWAPAETAYRDILLRFVEDVRKAGGTAILVTPVTRRHFGPDGKIVEDLADWSNAMRALAASHHIPLIDLEARSRAWLEQVGADASKAFYLHYRAEDGMAAFPDGISDDTHFSELGARHVAYLVAQGLQALDLPISHKIIDARPALIRTTPSGGSDCQ